MTYKVIQWATGNVGLRSLRAIVEQTSRAAIGCDQHADHWRSGRAAARRRRDSQLSTPSPPSGRRNHLPSVGQHVAGLVDTPGPAQSGEK